MVQEYSEITESLKKIQFKHKLNNILISGSAEVYGEFGKDEAEEFIYSLSNQLVKRDFKIVTGYGQGIGTYIVSGALEEIYSNKFGRVVSYLITRPFPFIHKGEIDRAIIGTNYRKTIIDECGVVVFIFGNKIDKNTDKLVDADGVFEEFEIAQAQGKVIIPVGSTGFMAMHIWETVQSNIKDYWYLEGSMDTLRSEKDSTKIFAEISKIISIVKGG